jgi:hypothetical protein
MFLARDEIMLSQECDVAEADVIYLIFDTLPTPGVLKLVMSWIMLETNVEERSTEPLPG